MSFGAGAIIFAVYGVEIVFTVFLPLVDHGVGSARLRANNVARDQFFGFDETSDRLVDIFGDFDLTRNEIPFVVDFAVADPDRFASFHDAGFLGGD